MFIKTVILFANIGVFLFTAFHNAAFAADINEVLHEVTRAISGNRARDYTMRLWQYDKWSTLPIKIIDESRYLSLIYRCCNNGNSETVYFKLHAFKNVSDKSI